MDIPTDISFDPETERIDDINEDLKLISKKDGLLFGTDSYFLAAFAKPARRGLALELGAGTGVVSLLCAQKGKYEKVVAIEINEISAETALRNAALNRLGDKISVMCADVRDVVQTDFGGPADAVISNPPYLKEGHGKNCASPILDSSRRELNGSIADFCRAAARLLRPGGSFSLVWRPDRLADLLYEMRAAGTEPKKIVTVYAYRDSPPSLVLVEGRAGSSPSLTWSRPLFIYEGRGSTVYTEDADAVYRTFSLEHLF